MTNEVFTASNGHTIEPRGQGSDHIIIKSIDGANVLDEFDYLDGNDQKALAEYLRAKEDERLGRWRFPEKDCMVVYDERVRLRVVDERDGDAQYIYRAEYTPGGRATNRFYATAAAFFDAHPPKKPWHDAKEGEVWLVTTEYTYLNAPAIVVNGEFVFKTEIPSASPGVDRISIENAKDARRIWPEA